MRAFIAAAFLLAVTPAFAATEFTTGTVAAFDRQANVVVMTDKTIWQLNANTILPENLVAGDVVKMSFRSSGDDGVIAVDLLERM